MQKQYVCNATVNFSDHKFFVRAGDLCKHNEITNDFVIYRNGELMATLKTSVMALKAMMTPETKYFTLVEEQAAVAPPVASNVVVVNEPVVDPIIINEEVKGQVDADFPEDDEDASLDESSEEEEEPQLGGMEVLAEKGVTMTLVDLREEPAITLTAGAPNFTKDIVTKDPDKIKAIAAKQKPGRKPGVVKTVKR